MRVKLHTIKKIVIALDVNKNTKQNKNKKQELPTHGAKKQQNRVTEIVLFFNKCITFVGVLKNNNKT